MKTEEKKVFKPMDEESAEKLKQDIKYSCYESLKEGRDIKIDEFVQRCIGQYTDIGHSTTPNDAVWVEQAFECAMEELLQEGIYVITVFKVLENKPAFGFDICLKAVDSEEVICASPAYLSKSVETLPKQIKDIIAFRKKFIGEMQDVSKADDFVEAIKSNKELLDETVGNVNKHTRLEILKEIECTCGHGMDTPSGTANVKVYDTHLDTDGKNINYAQGAGKADGCKEAIKTNKGLQQEMIECIREECKEKISNE